MAGALVMTVSGRSGKAAAILRLVEPASMNRILPAATCVAAAC